MKRVLLVLAGLAVGLPAMAALASLNEATTGGLPARYVPWTHAGRRIHPSILGAERRTPAPTVRARLEPPRRQRYAGREPSPVRGVPPALPRPRSPSAPNALGARATPRPWKAADLGLSLAAPAAVRPRGRFTYTIKLANRGPGTPDAITVRNMLPPGVDRTGSTIPRGVGGYAGGRDATLVVGRLAPGRSVTARLRVRVRRTTTGDLVARSRIVYSGGVRDRRPGDNAASVTTRIRH